MSFRVERVGGLAGVGFLIFIIAAFVLPAAAPPKLDDSVGDIREYFADHRTGVVLSGFFFGLAFSLFVVVGAALRAIVIGSGEAAEDRLLGDVVLGSAILTAAMSSVPVVAGGVLALRSARYSDELVVALYDVTALANSVALFPTALFLIAFSVSNERKAVVHRWLGIAGCLIGIALVFMAVANLFAEEGILAATGECTFVAIAATMIWFAALSVWLLRRSPSPAAA